MKQEYPKWMYGPENQARIFQKDEKVPKGWVDHPSKVKAEASKKPDDKTPPQRTEQEEKDRVETIASIREAGEEVADDATDEEINAAIDRLTAKAEKDEVK